MPSSGYLELMGLCLDERARSRSSGPTRPTSMTAATRTLANAESSGVTPSDRPAVPKAEVTSKREVRKGTSSERW